MSIVCLFCFLEGVLGMSIVCLFCKVLLEGLLNYFPGGGEQREPRNKMHEQLRPAIAQTLLKIWFSGKVPLG